MMGRRTCRALSLVLDGGNRRGRDGRQASKNGFGIFQGLDSRRRWLWRRLIDAGGRRRCCSGRNKRNWAVVAMVVMDVSSCEVVVGPGSADRVAAATICRNWRGGGDGQTTGKI